MTALEAGDGEILHSVQNDNAGDAGLKAPSELRASRRYGEGKSDGLRQQGSARERRPPIRMADQPLGFPSTFARGRERSRTGSRGPERQSNGELSRLNKVHAAFPA